MDGRTNNGNTGASDPKHWTESSLKARAVADLKVLCKASCVSEVGVKAKLVQRLLRLKEDDGGMFLRRKGWSSVNLPNLKEFCTSNGLPTGGNKDELIYRVMQFCKDHPDDSAINDKKQKQGPQHGPPVPAVKPPWSKRPTDRHPHDSGSDDAATLRLPIGNEVAGRVWAHRRGVDLYTGLSREECSESQVDHILDVRVLDKVMTNAKALASESGRVEHLDLGINVVKEVVNNVVNLNVSKISLNKMKQEMFTYWLTNSDIDLEMHATKSGICERHWTNIEKALRQAIDDIIKVLTTHADHNRESAQVVEAYVESMKRMGLARRTIYWNTGSSTPDANGKKEPRHNDRAGSSDQGPMTSKHKDRSHIDKELAESVWAHRKCVDLYTGVPRHKISDEQVDHILDIRVLDRVTTDTTNVTGRTKVQREWRDLGIEEVKKVMNGVVNLNVTDSYLKQRKQDVFTAWLSGSTTDLNKYAKDKGIESKSWANIKKALIQANDDIQQALKAKGDITPNIALVLETYGNSLKDMIEKMRL
jgi:hypothetical protein